MGAGATVVALSGSELVTRLVAAGEIRRAAPQNSTAQADGVVQNGAAWRSASTAPLFAGAPARGWECDFPETGRERFELDGDLGFFVVPLCTTRQAISSPELGWRSTESG